MGPNISFVQFETFCFLLTKIAYNIPLFWQPICRNFSFDEEEYPQLNEVAAKNEFYGISPSEEIEGKSGKNKLCQKDKKQKKNRQRFLVKSLSKIINKSKLNKSEKRFNDNAASISEHENDENCNLMNQIKNEYDEKKKKYFKKCNELKNVFVAICGVFGDDGDAEYYEKFEKKMNEKISMQTDKGTSPLQILNGFDVSDIC